MVRETTYAMSYNTGSVHILKVELYLDSEMDSGMLVQLLSNSELNVLSKFKNIFKHDCFYVYVIIIGASRPTQMMSVELYIIYRGGTFYEVRQG